ncbi:hypothetical protein BHE74_00036760, partial [Ensete ventricosum]
VLGSKERDLVDELTDDTRALLKARERKRPRKYPLEKAQSQACGWVGIEKEATQREGGFPSVGGFLVYDGESGAAGGSERAMGGGAAETTGGSGGGGGGFKARLVHYLYSGDKKHVFAGIAVISAVFAVPWFLMNRGTPLQLQHLPPSLSLSLSQP